MFFTDNIIILGRTYRWIPSYRKKKPEWKVLRNKTWMTWWLFEKKKNKRALTFKTWLQPKLNRIWALLDKHVKQHLPPHSDTRCEHFIFVRFVTHFTGLSDMIICAQEICHSFGTSPESFEALAATIQYVQEYQNPPRRWGTLSSYGNSCKGPWLSRPRLCRSCASLWAGDIFVSLRTLFLT